MKPFENLKVLDFTQFTSGPMCTTILGDLGAEVIKMENPPYGDNNRYNPPSVNKKTCYISSLDHSKKSALMNLKDERQKAIFLKMVETADVVIDNFKAGTMKKFGCDYETLKEINPRIICVSISGFGQTGPWSNRAAYDVIMQAVSGFMSVTGEKGGRPLRFGISMADVTSGLMCCAATVSAIYNARRTGKGCFIDYAMLDSCFALMEQPVTRYGLTGEISKPNGNRHPSAVPFGEVSCRDERVIICVFSDDDYRAFCGLIGRPELAEDKRFLTRSLRFEHMDECYEAVGEALADWNAADLLEKMHRAGLPCAKINNVKDVYELEHTAARNMIIDAVWPDGTRVKVAGQPIKLSDMEEAKERPVSTLGYDTIEVYSKYADPALVHEIFDPVLEESARLAGERAARLK